MLPFLQTTQLIRPSASQGGQRRIVQVRLPAGVRPLPSTTILTPDTRQTLGFEQVLIVCSQGQAIPD